MAYNRRDLIGHWVTRQQKTQQPCTHACCRGYRVHPENYPVILPDRTLHRASDEDLQSHFRKISEDDSPKARKAEAQILHEMGRRDAAEQKRADRASYRRIRNENVFANRAAARMERESETERIRLEAEKVTSGYMVSAKGRARGISNEEILTGRESVFNRYATDEARDYFASHPRPTASYFRGMNTRMARRG